MEKDFFEIYERNSNLAVEVGHNSTADWNLLIYDRRGRGLGDFGDPVIRCSGCDRGLVFASAYTALAEYLSDKYGAY